MTSSSPAVIGLYQGEDWSQQLTFYSDTAMTTPLVFTNPVMDLRTSRGLIARFDTTGTAEGTAEIPSDGVLVLSMPHASTATLPPGSYPVDIFADVAGRRKAISRVGTLQVVVTARSTQDDP